MSALFYGEPDGLRNLEKFAIAQSFIISDAPFSASPDIFAIQLRSLRRQILRSVNQTLQSMTWRPTVPTQARIGAGSWGRFVDNKWALKQRLRNMCNLRVEMQLGLPEQTAVTARELLCVVVNNQDVIRTLSPVRRRLGGHEAAISRFSPLS